MSSWTERMASVMAACGPRQPSSGLPYHRRLEKVKFGVPMDQVCKKDIPGPLLVMLLKLNKEGPFKKDVFRAPGHQGNMKKLIHFVQQGRLVNIHSFSVNTIASVLKKFLRKLPGGIFGPDNEFELFRVIKLKSEEEKLAVMQKVVMSLPIYSQHLLVLLFGTFRVIHSNSQRANTGMTAEALGVSVAPSFFHTCVAEGKVAMPDDVLKFKMATKITTFFIKHFGMRDLFGRENYEYYARLTGRILKVEDEWIFFTYPPVIFGSSRDEADTSRLDEPRPRRDSDPSVDPSLVSSGATALVEKTGSLEIIPESCPLDPNGRLSISLDDQNVSSPSSCGSHRLHRAHVHDFRTQTGSAEGEPKERRAQAEMKSYTLLPQWNYSRRHSSACATNWDGQCHCDQDEGVGLGAGMMALEHFIPPQKHTHRCAQPHTAATNVVHQRQTERMRHRSEWFLSDPTGLVTVKCRPDRPSSLGTQTSAYPIPGAPAQTQRSSPLLSISRYPPRTTTSSPIPPYTANRSFFASSSGNPVVRPAPPSPRYSLSSPFTSSRGSGSTGVCDMSSSAAMVVASLQVSQQLLPQTAHESAPYIPNPHITGSAAPTGGNGSTVRLRRRLSDKDKERRLVRRSSSKRKDKENGGKITSSSGSLDRGSAGALPTSSPSGAGAASLAPGVDSGPASLETSTPSKPRNAQLKRAGSADASGASHQVSDHPMLCRTGSQDNPPNVEPPAVLNRSDEGANASPLTRSLPRI